MIWIAPPIPVNCSVQYHQLIFATIDETLGVDAGNLHFGDGGAGSDRTVLGKLLLVSATAAHGEVLTWLLPQD